MTDISLPLLIEPEVLLPLLGNKQLIIIDLSSAKQYQQAHIESSVYLNFQQLMLGLAPAPGRIPSEEHLQALFSTLGITPSSHIVALDDEGGGWAGRLLWTLAQFGHENMSYLNGGIISWINEGFPTTADTPTITPSQYTESLNQADLVTAEVLIESFNSSAPVQIWDARSPAEFSGAKAIAPRAGHMPGAVNVEWTSLMDPSRNLRIREDARSRIESAGLNLSKPIVTHCQSHHRSGYTWLIGTILNLDIKGYPGSWSEWGNRTDTQVEL